MPWLLLWCVILLCMHNKMELGRIQSWCTKFLMWYRRNVHAQELQSFSKSLNLLWMYQDWFGWLKCILHDLEFLGCIHVLILHSQRIGSDWMSVIRSRSWVRSIVHKQRPSMLSAIFKHWFLNINSTWLKNIDLSVPGRSEDVSNVNKMTF